MLSAPAGQHGDCPQFIPLLEQIRIARCGKGRPRTRPGAAMAGKAYSSAANRAYLRKRGTRRSSRSRKTRRNIAAPAAGPAGGRGPAFDPEATKSAARASRPPDTRC
jgi:hypothetical protein